MQTSTPLARSCTFWFQDSHEKADFKHSLHPIATVKTLEDFWAYYQYLRRPSTMEESKHYTIQVTTSTSSRKASNRCGKTRATLPEVHYH